MINVRMLCVRLLCPSRISLIDVRLDGIVFLCTDECVTPTTAQQRRHSTRKRPGLFGICCCRYCHMYVSTIYNSAFYVWYATTRIGGKRLRNISRQRDESTEPTRMFLCGAFACSCSCVPVSVCLCKCSHATCLEKCVSVFAC